MVSIGNVPPIDRSAHIDAPNAAVAGIYGDAGPGGPLGDDSLLLVKVRKGDPDAMEVLYDRHREAGLVFARGLMSSRQEAEDVVQEAFVKVFSAIRNGAGPTDIFAAYMNTAIRSVANSFWKKYAWEQPVAEEALDTEVSEDPRLEAVLAVFEHERIAEAMRSLPERWRAVLWHAEVLGKMPREIAPILGIEANAVSALLIRARKGLRRAYEQSAGEHSTQLDPR